MSAVKISQRVTTIDLGAPARVGVGMPLLRLEKASFGESLRTVAVVREMRHEQTGCMLSMRLRHSCITLPLETRFRTGWKWLRLHTYKCAPSRALRNEFLWGLLCWERNA